MTPMPSFTAAGGAWQNFYLLVGGAAATLIGLMFVAITFGSSIVTRQSSTSARAFVDPTLTHFVQVLLTACLLLIPTMGTTLLGVLILLMSALRTAALFGVYRHMAKAQQVHHDLELSDWLMGVAVPLACYLVLGAAGAGFLAGYAEAFSALAVVTVAILLNGIYGAWELMLWMVITRTRTE
jgi:hypothetical protein